MSKDKAKGEKQTAKAPAERKRVTDATPTHDVDYDRQTRRELDERARRNREE